MKFGIRKPSIKKSIKARTTGKAKRTLKKAIIPGYGKKGMGVIKNPKKTAYNSIYNKTTVGINQINSNHNDAVPLGDNKDIWIIGIVILVVVLVVGIIIVGSSFSQLFKKRQEYNEILTKDINNNENTDYDGLNKQYIDEFISTTKINEKRFVEHEVISKYETMIFKCSSKSIYDNLFSDELKEKISYEQYKEYDICFIEGASASHLSDNEVCVSFMESVKKEGYFFIVRNGKITEFRRVGR